MMTTRTGRVVALVLGTVVVAGCSSFSAGAAATPPVVAVALHATTPSTTDGDSVPVDRRVFVEGDSLTVGVEGFLPPLLTEAGWTVTIDAQVGRSTAEGISALASQTWELGGTLVVALGTNDLPDPAAFSARIDQVMDIASGRRVIWVTVARSGFAGLDQALVGAEAKWPNLEVIDWRPVVAAYPSLVVSDGIHLTTAGYQLRAEFIAEAIQAVG